MTLTEPGNSEEQAGLEEGNFNFKNVEFIMHAEGPSRDAYQVFGNVDLWLKKILTWRKEKRTGGTDLKVIGEWMKCEAMNQVRQILGRKELETETWEHYYLESGRK